MGNFESCPYRGNDFCRAQSDDAIQRLCATCRIRQLDAGKWLPIGYWDKSPATLVKGMIVMRSEDPLDSHRISRGSLVSAGAMLSAGSLLCQRNRSNTERASAENEQVQAVQVCLVNCEVAVFDNAVCAELYETDMGFVKAILSDLNRAWNDANDLLCNKDAYDDVRYVVKYCRACGIADLTHAQIALASGRRRQVVTKIMHQLLEREPELFQQHR